jgi:hypothetical protein
VFIKIREIGLNQFYQFVENVGFKKNQKLRKFENSKIKKPNGKKPGWFIIKPLLSLL